ncbi:MAG: hypothetical protein KJ709_08975 [Nanoarchaeota archaeon]|nr:hypothetical protein [Nanoarchaeota archaeon]
MSEEAESSEDAGEEQAEGQDEEEHEPQHDPEDSETLEKKVEDTEDDEIIEGAVVLIRYQSEDGKEIEFYFEVKTPGYPVKEYVGKANCVGGAHDKEDATYRDTVIRELLEEMDDKEAARLIIEHMSRNPIGILWGGLKGKVEPVYFYESVIDSKQEWDIVSGSGISGDGGRPAVRELDYLNSLSYGWGTHIVLESVVKDLTGRTISLPNPGYGDFRYQKLREPEKPVPYHAARDYSHSPLELAMAH